MQWLWWKCARISHRQCFLNKKTYIHSHICVYIRVFTAFKAIDCISNVHSYYTYMYLYIHHNITYYLNVVVVTNTKFHLMHCNGQTKAKKKHWKNENYACTIDPPFCWSAVVCCCSRCCAMLLLLLLCSFMPKRWNRRLFVSDSAS